MFRNILVATDGSSAAEHAAKVAVNLARSQGARLTAVYVVDPYPYLGLSATNPMGLYAYLSAARAHAATAHSKIITLCAAQPSPVPLELRLVEHATAAKGIVQVAKDEGCDLIVAGSHGRSGFDRLVQGSVAAKLSLLATVPVLIVH